MGRKKDDTIRDHFEETNGISKCKYCESEFKGKPSVTRLRKHLLGERDGGIRVCMTVPNHVKETIFSESNKRPRLEPSPSNNLVSNSISTSAPQQNNGFENQEQDKVRMEAVVQQGTEQDIFQFFDTEDDIGHGNLEDSGALETRADALVTTELVGELFQRRIDEIRSSIMKDEVLGIGIYGMGGTGKTELAKHVHNKLLENQNFHQVYWVTVSPDFSIHSLQHAVAKAVQLDLSSEDDENKRAAMLSKALIEKKKYVLILDDVWSYIPLDSVGVHVSLNGCKVILTTRSLDVCRRMDCNTYMKVEHHWLINCGDWSLFIKILGSETNIPLELEQIAKSIVKECNGLPLMLVSMARSMKGVGDIHEWRNALEELKGSKPRQDNVEVFQRLKLSYIHLKEPALQKCFIYCAMFYGISKEELIEHLIVEGIIGGMVSRRAAVDKGHAMLNKLQNACLIEYESSCIFMHSSIRRMAIQVMKESIPSKVEAGRQLTSLPIEKWWIEDILRVSLMDNDIKEIPSQYLPTCPNLSTLILCDNRSLKSIAEPFFDQMHGLKVLNLCRTAIEKLPESVADLENLTALFLRKCEHLKDLPSLKKLGALEVLDLCYCRQVEKVPEGLEWLTNLRYLNLHFTKVVLSTGILRNLNHLQFLAFHISFNTGVGCSRIGDVIINGGWSLCLENAIDLDKLSIRGCKEIEYFLCLRSVPSILHNLESMWVYDMEKLSGVLCSKEGDDVVIPIQLPPIATFSRLKVFRIRCCHSIKKLFPFGLLSNLQNLQLLCVEECSEMEEIIALEEPEEGSNYHSILTHTHLTLPNLRHLELFHLPKLKSICSAKLMCDSLQHFRISSCPELKKIPIVLPLPSIELITAYPKEWWESVEWGHPDKKTDLLPKLLFLSR